eukprot:TRINITY_DN8859_c0_g1_i1.p1 TRINITY_DN8859_c0_g1~~TRINITY_DN8859_c0_g1_i1.p1  ORF type:complete len:184 (+),score=22.00 TRINITY_DN8859_c0_g1_i1:110-661(+)
MASETKGLIGENQKTEAKSGTIPGLIKTCMETGMMTTVAYFVESGPLDNYPAKDYKIFAIAVYVYFFAAYWMVMRQGVANAALNTPEVVNSTEKQAVDLFKNHNRTTGNMLEQMPCLILVLVPYAMWCNPILAGYLLLVYTAFMLLYPVLYDFGTPILFASTMPRYLINYYMAGSILLTALRT